MFFQGRNRKVGKTLNRPLLVFGEGMLHVRAGIDANLAALKKWKACWYRGRLSMLQTILVRVLRLQ